MTNKIFFLSSTFKTAGQADDGDLKIRGMASTPDIDRAGDVIIPDAWKKGGLENFKANPIILFNHDHNRPIGRATDIVVNERGLELEAKISKAAGDNVYGLVKDGTLGTFSVGFMIKDADYIEETGGLRIKDAELFETSVVSVPMNQAATFSVAKSFNSMSEYEDFKKTFTNRVDLAGQSLAEVEDKSSSAARNTPAGESRDSQVEIKMENQKLDVAAIVKQATEEAAASFAMKLAEQKAAEQAAQKKAEQEAAEKAALVAKAKEEALAEARVEVKTSAERLVEDFQKQLNAKDADMQEVINKFKSELEEKNGELEKMRLSRGIFADRGGRDNIEKHATDFLYAHMLGVITGKGWNTDFAKQIQQKAGIDYVTNAPDIDQEVGRTIEKEIMRDLKVARLFREIKVNGAATVLPIQMDTGLADWAINATSGNLENRGASNNSYQPKQVILNAYRLVSSTFMDNDVDEQVLVNLMPMLVEGVARAHARTVEKTILTGDDKSSENITGLDTFAADYSKQIDLDATSVATGDSALMTADLLLGMRQSMGKYGINPGELAYIVSQNSYYDLLSDAKFQTIDEVGSDMAVRVTGSVGAVYGTPVVVSDEFPTEAAGQPAAFCVNTRNYVIPRLRNVTVEQDYEVMNQRRVIVASQSLGFEEILAGDGAGTEPSMKITFTA